MWLRDTLPHCRSTRCFSARRHTCQSCLIVKGIGPNIGDADDSVVLRTQLAPEPYVASIVSLAAAHLGQPAPWVQCSLRHSILGLDAAEVCKKSTSRCFNHGGLSVLRSGAVQLFFDHGPLGFGTLPGHGHADALSVWMQANGRPIWVDTGTGFYNRDSQWRSWIRHLHNTVTMMVMIKAPKPVRDGPIMRRKLVQ